ncbi:MAG: 4Fe-4S binding protein [Coriobacteriia bacterium]|jgi:ferredoxin-type protein NapH|nr:4Fe-4S binding protein [Coriobacteriia bacterium]
MKITTARKITLWLVVLAVVGGIAVSAGTGTLSSFGWESIAAICPLGAIETFLASKTIFPRALIVLVILIGVGVVLGKVFCAWLCPVPPLRKFFTFKNPFKKEGENAESGNKSSRLSGESVKSSKLSAKSAKSAKPSSESKATAALASEIKIPESCDSAKDPAACPSGCTSCAEKRKKFDSRHVVLGGALVSTAIFGFPVFCIVCPVGLTFASIVALWRLVGFNEPSWALLIFPLIIIVELFVLKKWCFKFCPLGAVMSLMSIPNRLFRPRVDSSKCLREQGGECTVCVSVCEEGLDPHFSDGMHECTKCGVCKEECPAQAISIPLYAPAAKHAPPKDKPAPST